MKKLQLTEWAAIGELLGTAAVIVSLLFLAYSVGQNTEAVHGSMENLLFERHAALQNNFITDPAMADIYARMQSGDAELTVVESVRWQTYQTNLLDIWAFAYMRHEGSLLGEREWHNWDDYFAYVFAHGPERLSAEDWRRMTYGFDPQFWAHVGQSLGYDSGN
jgi:hypothetical protein